MYNCHLDTQPGDLGPFKGCYLVTSTERSFSPPSKKRLEACLAPRPHFSSRLKRFGSRGPRKNVFPALSPRIRHRNELTERDWENVVQGLGKLETSKHPLNGGSGIFLFELIGINRGMIKKVGQNLSQKNKQVGYRRSKCRCIAYLILIY